MEAQTVTLEKSVEELIEGLQSDNARIRDRYFYELLHISEETPEKLYPAWDSIAAIFRKPEVSNRFVAIQLLANLVRVDTDGKFDQLFDEFYALISHESPVVSPHIAGLSGKIMLAIPHLLPKIIPILLDIEALNNCRHPELLKSYVIEAFDEAFDILPPETQRDAVGFAEKHVDSTSPKTRGTAKKFLEKRAQGT